MAALGLVSAATRGTRMGGCVGLGTQSEPAKVSALRTERAVEAGSRSAIFYIDKQRLSRDCVTEQLAMHLPEWTIEPVQSARDLPNSSDGNPLALVILHVHGASVGTASVAEELAEIKAAATDLPVVLMSELDDAQEVRQAIESGARGYLPTTLPITQAIAAIRLVAHGGTYVPPVALPSTPSIQKPRPVRPTLGLSPRELQVLAQLQQGKQNKLIAHELKMSESTVKVHLRHIMKKLNARNRTQVVLMTHEKGRQ